MKPSENDGLGKKHSTATSKVKKCSCAYDYNKLQVEYEEMTVPIVKKDF